MLQRSVQRALHLVVTWTNANLSAPRFLKKLETVVATVRYCTVMLPLKLWGFYVIALELLLLSHLRSGKFFSLKNQQAQNCSDNEVDSYNSKTFRDGCIESG